MRGRRKGQRLRGGRRAKPRVGKDTRLLAKGLGERPDARCAATLLADRPRMRALGRTVHPAGAAIAAGGPWLDPVGRDPTLSRAGSRSSTLAEWGSGDSTLEGAGSRSSTLAGLGSGDSTLKGAGSRSSTLAEQGSRLDSTLRGAGSRSSTLAEWGSRGSTLLQTGSRSSTLAGLERSH
eukprot:3261741-Prymnesium_polylepis.2